MKRSIITLLLIIFTTVLMTSVDTSYACAQEQGDDKVALCTTNCGSGVRGSCRIVVNFKSGYKFLHCEWCTPDGHCWVIIQPL